MKLINKIYLRVSYSEKEEAKALGAKWDSGFREWYTEDASNSSLISRFGRNRKTRKGHYDSKSPVRALGNLAEFNHIERELYVAHVEKSYQITPMLDQEIPIPVFNTEEELTSFLVKNGGLIPIDEEPKRSEEEIMALVESYARVFQIQKELREQSDEWKNEIIKKVSSGVWSEVEKLLEKLLGKVKNG